MMRDNKGNRILDFKSDYVVIDLETTSRNINYAEIIEVGAIKVENGGVVDTFVSFVKPEFDISQEITEVTGITNEMVQQAPSAVEFSFNYYTPFVMTFEDVSD